MATYRYLFADLLTNAVIAELPLTGVSFTKQLNQAGAFSAHLLLTGIDSAAFNVDASTIPTKCAVYVDKDGTLIWGGIIWGRGYSNASQSLTINAREFESYFERRIIGTADTFILAWLITKEPITAGAIAGFEVITKTILYYFHERGWNKINWGRV